MLTTINHTPFAAALVVLQDKDGVDTAVAVIKATFQLDTDRISVSKNQQPILFADQYRGEPGKSSLLYASEAGLPKPNTDIAMNGHAYGNGRYRIDVGLTVGDCRKVVRVFGDRFWKGLFSLGSITDPQPFHKMPLDYEHAYGGWDEHKSNPEKDQTWPENPVGTGFIISGGKKEIKGSRLPNIENPGKLMKDPYDRLKPAGFGFMAPHWEPRSSHAGTYDRHWHESRMPFPPEDFSPGYYNAAHPDLITTRYLEGNEEVVIVNASPKGTLRFRLPALSVSTVFHIQGNTFPRPACFETLILEPDEERFMMVFKASMPCDKKMYHVQSAEVRHLFREAS